MTIPLPLRLMGAPGSPYTRKMLALLRYRRLSYQLLIGDQSAGLGMPRPKVALLPTFYLPNASGELEAVVDSTPLIRRFEAAFDGRSVIPPDPVVGFLNDLLEDYADEWLTKPMFHYRWRYAADIEQAATILPMWRDVSASPEALGRRKTYIAERQIARLYVVGSDDTTAPVIEASYRRFLAIFDSLLQRHSFLFGSRPSAADFGLYGQLTQLARFDPTPSAICLREAPRVYAWTDLVDDLSGAEVTEDAWMTRSAAAASLRELLCEVGRVYAPATLANARAHAAGEKTFETTIDGRSWVQPTFPYQAKCLAWLREAFAALGDGDARALRSHLDGTGCEGLLEAPR